jgi:5-carboxymethyl-2-hydroxymuconate isomerase
MPHLVIEYSRKLEHEIDITELRKKLHTLLSQQQPFTINDIKSRSIAYDDYNVGEISANNHLFHIQLRVMSGKTREQLSNFSTVLGECASKALPSNTALTVETVTMPSEYYFKQSPK